MATAPQAQRAWPAPAAPLALRRWAVSAAALAVTVLLVTTLRGPCRALLDNRDEPGLPPGSLPDDGDVLEDPFAAFAAGGRVGAYSAHADARWLHVASEGPRTLTVDVMCGGMAEQRLALAYAAIAAKHTGRALVMPQLAAAGARRLSPGGAAAAVAAALDAAGGGGEALATAEVGDVYDSARLADVLAQEGVRVLTRTQFADAARGAAPVRFALPDAAAVPPPAVADVAALFAPAAGARHVVVDCPLAALPPAALRAERRLLFRVLSALRPAEWLAARADAEEARMGGGGFNFLRLAVERGVEEPCHRPPPAEVPRGNSSNCTYYTASVHGALADMRVTSDLPLYVSADWAAADESLAADALAGLKRAGYRVFRSPQEAGVAVEAGAAGDYELALRAERFVGSGRDPFSALALAERRRARRWAGLYAGFAAPPLRRAAPLLDAPWVFTLNSWSLAQEVYVRAAVASAEAQGGVVPHCVFAGDESAPVAQWLRSRGVQVLPYQPTWAERLKRAARAGGGAGATAGGGGSKARLGGDALVGTFQRIDIPIVPGLEQYGHVLYTDTDVFFRRPFDWSELPHPPPAAVGLGPEAANRYPFSVGVMVLHLPALRASHERFVEYALSHNLAQRKGGIQLAYNQFYEAEVKAWRLPIKFNAKPYHHHAPRSIADVAIVHLQGPKPLDYLTWHDKHGCGANDDLCRSGVAGRACVYLRDWIALLEPRERARYQGAWDNACSSWEFQVT